MTPFCAVHAQSKVWDANTSAFHCGPCDVAAFWSDEEADVNDYAKREVGGGLPPIMRTAGDHIYPHLHGTGGIGPGQWVRGGLAAGQEAHALGKRTRAGVILLMVTMAVSDIMLQDTVPTVEETSALYDSLEARILKLL